MKVGVRGGAVGGVAERDAGDGVGGGVAAAERDQRADPQEREQDLPLRQEEQEGGKFKFQGAPEQKGQQGALAAQGGLRGPVQQAVFVQQGGGQGQGDVLIETTEKTSRETHLLTFTY